MQLSIIIELRYNLIKCSSTQEILEYELLKISNECCNEDKQKEKKKQ